MPKAAAKKRFPLIPVIIAVVAVAAIAIGAAVYLSYDSSDAIYVVSSVTYYEDDEASVTTYELDENGNVLSSTTDDGSGDFTYVVNEDGFYIERSYTYEDEDDGTVTVTETRTITETDDEGRPTTILSVTAYSTGTTIESTTTYTYRNNGMLLSSTTAITGGYTTEVTYTTHGFIKTYTLTWEEATSYTREYTYDYETEDGVVVGCTITNQDDEYGILEFEYDDNGNLITYTSNGTVLYEYTYTKISNPSLAAQIASQLSAAGPVL